MIFSPSPVQAPPWKYGSLASTATGWPFTDSNGVTRGAVGVSVQREGENVLVRVVPIQNGRPVTAPPVTRLPESSSIESTVPSGIAFSSTMVSTSARAERGASGRDLATMRAPARALPPALSGKPHGRTHSDSLARLLAAHRDHNGGSWDAALKTWARERLAAGDEERQRRVDREGDRESFSRGAAVIGIPGLGLYLAARALDLNTTVAAADLTTVWWTIPVLVLAAGQNAVLEEVIMLGYLFTRWREAGWSPVTIVVVSALVRGSYHLYQGLGGFLGGHLAYVLPHRVPPDVRGPGADARPGLPKLDRQPRRTLRTATALGAPAGPPVPCAPRTKRGTGPLYRWNGPEEVDVAAAFPRGTDRAQCVTIGSTWTAVGRRAVCRRSGTSGSTAATCRRS